MTVLSRIEASQAAVSREAYRDKLYCTRGPIYRGAITVTGPNRRGELTLLPPLSSAPSPS